MDNLRVHHSSLLAIFFAISFVAAAAPSPRMVRFSPAFEDNRGQADVSTRFIARTPRFSLHLGAAGDAVYSFPAASSVAKMRFLGAANVQPESEGRVGSFTQYYRRGMRVDDVQHYGRIRYRNIYPGIDLLWRQRTGGLEFDFAVSPGADVTVIRFRIEGTLRQRIDMDGRLLAETPDGILQLDAPAAFQDPGPGQSPVAARYRLEQDVVTFEVGKYDASRPLLIDPAVDFSTYLGGLGFDGINATAVDASGNIYITGETTSASIQPADVGPSRPTRDIFVAKLSADGSSLIYATVLGASGNDRGNAIAVDASGNVFITGEVSGSGLPVTVGALQTTPSGGNDAFAARLDAQGRIVYCTYLGGSGDDVGKTIAVDTSGNAFIGGYTSTLQFTTTPTAPQKVYRGGLFDGFLIKLNSLGTAALFSTLLGGAGTDQIEGVALDSSGAACLVGYSESPDLAIHKSLHAYAGGGDAFAACVDPSNAAWSLLTYIGGHGVDRGSAIAIDSSRNIYIAGHTVSTNFPATNGVFQRNVAGSYDMFVAKITDSGALTFSTLIGGSGSDSATAIALDSARRVWIAGYSASNDFPLRNAWRSFRSGSFEATVSQLSVDGSNLILSSFVGGTGDDRGYAIGIDSAGSVVIAGLTFSPDLVTTGAAVDKTPGGSGDGFVMKIKPDPSFTLAVTPNTGTSANPTYTLIYSDPSPQVRVNVAYFLINSTLAGAQGCLLEYTASTNMMRLLGSSGMSWQGAAALGSASSLNNGLCAIDLSLSSAVQTGSVFTMDLAMRFSGSFQGAKSLYAQIITTAAAHQWHTIGQWNVPSNQPPTAVSSKPNAGSGPGQAFQFVLTDPNGAEDITTVHILINSAIIGAQACLVDYNATTKSLRLLSDNALGWIGPLSLGSTGMIQNSQCALSAAGTSAVTSGTTLTLTLLIAFKSVYAGPRVIYASVLDASAAGGSWQVVGSWNVEALGSPPGIVYATPTSGAGRSGSFTVVFSDPDGHSDLRTTYILLNASLSGMSACLVEYTPQTNVLRLIDDNGVGWRASATIGATASMENSQCIVDLRSSWVSRSGTDLALNVALTFKPSFAGGKQIYGLAYDSNMLTKGWQVTGAWTVQ